MHNGDAEVLKVLLEHGANPNYASPGGHSLLIEAIKKQNIEIVKILLNNGADVNYKIRSQLPMFYAIQGEGNAELVKLLLNNGADLKSPALKRSLLTWAADHGHADIVRMLPQ